MIEAGLDESFEAGFIERQPGGDEIDVESGGARGADEIEDIRAGERFAAGEVGLQDAESGSLAKDAGPVFSGQFETAGLKFERIRAVDAVQRAAMG